MSTSNTNPLSPNVTEDQLEAYIRQVAADEAKKLGTQQEAPAVSTPAPIKLNIAGKPYEFSSPEEASATLTSVYQSMQAPPAPTQTTGRTVTSDADSPYAWTPADQKAYVDMLVENPLRAQDYLDEKRFGVKNPSQVIKNQMATIAQLTQAHTIDHFVSTHKDYPVSPESAQSMESVMKEFGYPISPAGLEAAYAIADKRGMFKRPEAATQNTQQAYNPYLAAPPVASRVSSTGGQDPSWMNEAEQMSLEGIESIFAKFNR